MSKNLFDLNVIFGEFFFGKITNVGNEIIVYNGDYNKYEFLDNIEVGNYIKAIKKFPIYKNKNQNLNKILAGMFINEYRYDLIKFVKIFALNINDSFSSIEKQMRVFIPKEIERLEKFLIEETVDEPITKEKKLSYRGKIYKKYFDVIKNIEIDNKSKTLNILNFLLSKNSLSYVFEDVFLAPLFERLTYLFDYRTPPENINFLQLNAPKELKGLVISFLKKKAMSKDGSEFMNYIETLINRDIYKHKIKDFEVFDIINLFKENTYFYNKIISTNRFIKKEYYFYDKLIVSMNDEISLKYILKTLKKIKSPKPHTKKNIHYIENRLDEISKYNIDDTFKTIKRVKKLVFTVECGNEKFMKNNDIFMKNNDIYPLHYVFSQLNNEKSLIDISLNKINIEKNKSRGLLEISMEYEESKLSQLDENYYKLIINEIVTKYVNFKNPYDSFNSKKIISNLKIFRLNYLLEKNTDNKIESTTRRKNKI